MHLTTDEQLQQLLLGADLEVTGDRETDIDALRSWRMREVAQDLSTRLADVHVENKLGHGADALGVSNTTVNVNIYSVTGSRKRKEALLRSESERFQQGAMDEYLHVEMDDPLSSPESESPTPNDYSTWSAAALRREAAARDPPIRVPAKQKAEMTRRDVAPQLQELDRQA